MFSYPTPFTPPTTEEDDLLRLRLIRSRRVGPTTFHRLIAEYGSVGAALEALPGIAAAAGESDYKPFPEGVARAELAAGRRAGARLLHCGAPEYPALLAQTADAPPLLWALGDVTLAARPCVALVGARNASSLGARMARRLAEDLGRAGFVVVSGLARGIDAEAHRAALPTGTIAAQAGGIEVIYPPENTELAAAIATRGLRLSEHPPGMEPRAQHFPMRNRIISGLSQATVVIEAAARSGSLITARCAADQGREVMAVPGHPMDGRAFGCNALIRDGATLIRGIEDILEVLGEPAVNAPPPETQAAAPAPPAATGPAPRAPRGAPRPSARRADPDTDPLEARLLARLGPSPTPEDDLIEDLGCSAADFAAVVLALELDDQITRHPGAALSRPA